MNINDLTLAEIAIIENKAGQPFADLTDSHKPKAALLTALCWVMKKREDPKFTYEQASSLTMNQMNDLIGAELDPLDKN